MPILKLKLVSESVEVEEYRGFECQRHFGEKHIFGLGIGFEQFHSARFAKPVCVHEADFSRVFPDQRDDYGRDRAETYELGIDASRRELEEATEKCMIILAVCFAV